ncbi:hypothetical protein M3Y97_00005500 [Aphelenchoides bicaudatus]|nr:hypothetical protein M3Y97_00005500 [Aphelenchoides bicaudatus]
MMSKLFILSCALFAIAAAHGHHGGPFGDIFRNLTDDQRSQLKDLFRNSFNETKSSFKSQLSSFVSSLNNADATAAFNNAQQKFNDFKANITAKAQNLNADAKQLVTDVLNVLSNEDITIGEEHQQIRDLIQKASSTTLDEIKNAGIPVPGMRRGHGGRAGRFNSGSDSDSNEWNGSRRGFGSGFGSGRHGSNN